MEAPPVVVIILNWNRPHDTLACLRSLQAADDFPWRAIVVDNASSDDSVSIIRSAFPDLELIVTERNLGFAGGMNAGIRRALVDDPPYLLLLNNDTTVAPDTLSTLIAAADDHPQAGILSPLIRYSHEERIWFAGAYRRRFLPGISMPRYRRRTYSATAPVEIDYATGCAMLLRRKMIEEIGGFDDSYFMYWEDLDLGERARQAGWSVLLVPSAVVWHHVSASTGEMSPRKWYYFARYMPLFYQRHYRWPRAALSAYILWVVAREVVLGHWRILPAFLRGAFAGWRAVFGEGEKTADGSPPL